MRYILLIVSFFICAASFSQKRYGAFSLLDFSDSSYKVPTSANVKRWIATMPGGSGGGASLWGQISGELSNQTDLMAALNAKLSASTSISINGETKALNTNPSFTLSFLTPAQVSSRISDSLTANEVNLVAGSNITLNKVGKNITISATGGGGGGVTSVFGRTGAVTAQANDYTWAQIDKTVSSLADLTTRSASDLSSGTLADARLSSNVLLGTNFNLTTTGTSGPATWNSATKTLNIPNYTVSGGSSPWTQSGGDIYYSGGNVGIGKTSPGYLLEVHREDTDMTTPIARMGNSARSVTILPRGITIGPDGNSGINFTDGGSVVGSGSTNPLHVRTTSNNTHVVLQGIGLNRGNVLVGDVTNEASSILTIHSTTKGVLLPRMTTAQKTSINSPAKGLMVYDSTLNSFEYYDGSSWKAPVTTITAGTGISVDRVGNNVTVNYSGGGFGMYDDIQTKFATVPALAGTTNIATIDIETDRHGFLEIFVVGAGLPSVKRNWFNFRVGFYSSSGVLYIDIPQTISSGGAGETPSPVPSITTNGSHQIVVTVGGDTDSAINYKTRVGIVYGSISN